MDTALWEERCPPGLGDEMRITVHVDDGLLEQAKAEARQRHETLASLIEEGLRLVLANRRTSEGHRKIILPVSRERGGVLPGVDLDNNSGRLDIIEERR